LSTATRTERMQRVLALLETKDSVHVSELAGEFAVSEVTVRTDLAELARQGLVARVRGGVRGCSEDSPSSPSMSGSTCRHPRSER